MVERKSPTKTAFLDNPAVSRDDINKMIDNINIKKGMNKSLVFETERDKVLIMLCYISGGRISEVINLKGKHFKFNRPQSSNYLIDSFPNLKNKKNPDKIIPIPKNDKFAEPIRSYVEKYVKDREHYLFFHVEKRNGKPFIATRNIYRDYAVYKHDSKLNKKIRVGSKKELIMAKGQLSVLRHRPMTRQMGWAIIKKHCGNDYWPHIFRHFRLSHLGKSLTERQLITISGHRTSLNLESYIRLNPNVFEGDIIPVD